MHSTTGLGTGNWHAAKIHHNKWVYIAFSHTYSLTIAQSHASAFADSFQQRQ